MLSNKVMFLYELSDPRTNEVRYVGITAYPERREKAHCSGKGKTYRSNWIRELLREGLKPIFRIVEGFPPGADIEDAEMARIYIRRREGCSLTNLTDGGEGAFGYKYTEEQKRAHSESHKGFKVSEETKVKLRGRKQSKDTKNKRRNAWTEDKKLERSKAYNGRELDEATKVKMSEAHRGVEFSEEHRRKLSENKKRYYQKQREYNDELLRRLQELEKQLEDTNKD